MTALPKYKVLPVDDSVIVYFPQSMDIISMKSEEFSKSTEEQLQDYYAKFLEESQNKRQHRKPPISKKISLIKLMVSMSDNCNLDCEYCYAQKYYKKKHMSKETIDKVISKFLLSDSVSSIGTIVFFGGEPLLNIEGIEYFANKLEELVEQGRISKLPGFGIITNGTIYSERVLRLVKKYKMFVTVSMDGPAEIQDSQRRFRGSKRGSHDIVTQNLKKMISDGIGVNIECTVTKQAFDAGYNHNKLKEYFSDEFNLNHVIYVPENITSPEKKFDFDAHFYDPPKRLFTLLENLEINDLLFEIPYGLLHKKPRYRSCLLGQYIFHIQANGMVSPCQVISGLEEYDLIDINSFNDSFFHDNSWITKYFANSQRCNSCWVKLLCQFCPARMVVEYDAYIMPEDQCAKRIKEIEDLIINVVKLRQDPVRWNDFSQRLKSKRKLIEERLEPNN